MCVWWCHLVVVSEDVGDAHDQGLTLAHFRAQLEDLRETSTGYVGLYGRHSQLKLSGKGQGKLKLSGNGNECKPLPMIWRNLALRACISSSEYSPAMGYLPGWEGDRGERVRN